VSLVYRYIDSELTAINTIGVRDGGAHTIEAATTVATTVLAWWVAHMKALVTTHCELIQLNVLDLGSETGISLEYVTGLPIVGTDGGQPSPVNACPIVTFRSEGRGRSSRGRNYVVAAPADAFEGADGTQVASTWRTNYTNAYTALGTAIAAEDMDHAILSEVLAEAIPVISYQCRSYIGTQRRRASSP
jgi:hypothetical protein